MNPRSRRGLAALATAASLAAGLLTLAPSAQADTGSTSGQIGLFGGATGFQLINPDGSGLHSVAGFPYNVDSPNWAPDGSRAVTGQGSTLATGRVTGSTSLLNVPPATDVRSNAPYDDPTYWLDGRFLVFSTGGQLTYGPSDSSYAPRPLLTDAQEPSTVCDLHPTGSPDHTLAFQRLTDNCSVDQGIWTYNLDTDEVTQLIASGSSPAYSADGTQLAFVRAVDGVSQLFTANADGTNVQQVTTDAAEHLNPTWNPENYGLAYDSVTDGVKTAKILDFESGNTIYPLTGTGAKPAWQPLKRNTLVRVYGTGSIGIDAAASRYTFDAVGAAHEAGLVQAKSVVLTSRTNSTYSSLAVALGAEKQAPVVYTAAGALDASAVAELKRVLPKGGGVYLNGSTSLLSANVATQVQALGYTVVRLDAPDLPSLSVRVAKQITPAPSWVFIADGREYHDPIVASAAAGSLGYRGTGVVLLTNGSAVSSSVTNYINSLNPATTGLVTVGATAEQAFLNVPITQDWSYWPLSGATHEDLAVNVAKFWWTAPDVATVQDTWSWDNAVAASSVSATYGPVLWSAIAELSAPTETYLGERAASVNAVQSFGGNASYSPAMRTSIGSSVAASSSWMSTVWAEAGVLPATPALQALRVAPAPEVSNDDRPTAGTKVVPGQHLPAPQQRSAH